MLVRLPDGDRQADRLGGLSYRRLGSDGQSDGLLKMVDEWSDDDGQSDRLIMGWMGGVTDGCVNDKMMGCQTDWSYDGWMGMTDRLDRSQTDGQVD